MFELPEMFMLNEQDSLAERRESLEAAGSVLTGAYTLWDHWSEDERRFTVMTFLKVRRRAAAKGSIEERGIGRERNMEIWIV